MVHSFDVNIAKRYGIQEAVLFNHLYFWIEKNKANNKHYYDGYYWTYSSKKAFTELFPYLTERQVDYALKKLLDNGLVVRGNYNKSGYDRTLWYAITKKGYSILQNCQMEGTNLSNPINNNVGPIPDSNTDIKTDINGQDEPDQPKKEIEEVNWERQYEDFYEKYPKKVKKQIVRKWFEKNKPSSELFSSMMSGLEQFRGCKEWLKDNGQYIPYPSTWLNQRRWEDEDITIDVKKNEKVEYKTIDTTVLTDEEYEKLLKERRKNV